MGHSRKKLDLTGQRFGMLTVVGPAENVGARTAWHCQCDCGGRVVQKTLYLRNGHAKSCGCLIGKSGISGSAEARKRTPEHIQNAAKHLNFIDGTCVEMLRVKTPRRNNKSGVVGVEWQRSHQRWRATICFKGRRYYLGRFEMFEDAVAARKQAEALTHDAFVRAFDRACGLEEQVKGS